MNNGIKGMLVALALALTACVSGNDAGAVLPEAAAATSQAAAHALEPTYAAMIASQRDPRIPDLPFPDNPDPSQCGIPIQWGLDDPAWLSGIYEGELVQPMVFLYDSHLRLKISGEAPHGSKVTIKLYQQNPVTDYYLVKVEGAGQPTAGWVPAPFISFEPVEPLTTG